MSAGLQLIRAVVCSVVSVAAEEHIKSAAGGGRNGVGASVVGAVVRSGVLQSCVSSSFT